MRKDRYNKRKFHSKSLTLVLAISLAFVLVISCSVGATLAWLKDTTDPVVNTFTYGDINITLTETDTDPETEGNQYSYKMVPGNTIAKDPKVTVLANSETCWLFVKIVESENFDDFMTYTIADGWTALDETNHPGVYYREVASSNEDKPFYVLSGGTDSHGSVIVKGDVTKEQLNALDSDSSNINYPTLTFTAYAIQKAHFDTAEAAWDEISTNP